ncbi:MAG TPA: hypothetical protein VJN89_09695 [Candidatus Acidoferrum sp.]|nr:hypothetical protein [Candidatus Acidoferrum sp.]
MCKQIFVLVASAVIWASPATAQAVKSSWGQETAEKLSRFLPQPAPGLVPQTPWGSQRDNHVDLSVGFEASVGTQSNEYVIARALQKWWFDDPELFQLVASAERDRKKSDQEATETFKAHQEEYNALQKQIQELAKSGQTKELQAAMEKMKAYTPNDAKGKEMDNRIRNLKGSAHSLEIYIEANATAANTLDPSAQPSGTVHGHPLYRVVWPGPVKPLTWVNLAVYVGPPGFQNPDTGGSKSVLKCVLVWLRVTSRPDNLKSDEALARRVLEAIDYEGLAKLIEP